MPLKPVIAASQPKPRPPAPIEPVAGDAAAFQTWTGPGIGGEIHNSTLADAYKQWTLLRAARQPRLRDVIAGTANKCDDMMLHLKKMGDDYVVVQQSGWVYSSLIAVPPGVPTGD